MKQIVCITLLVETSPQALPLGAACIASALRHSSVSRNHEVALRDFSLEEKNLSGKNQDEVADAIAQTLLSDYPELSMAVFSVYVWNRNILERTSRILKANIPGLICTAGGPEVTANPLNFLNFDFLTCGEGENSVSSLAEILLASNDASVADLSEEKEGFAFGIQGIYRNKNLIPGADVDAGLNNKNNDSGAEKLYGVKGEKVQLPTVYRSLTPDPQKLTSPYLDGTLDPRKYGGVLWELARGCPFKCSYCYESKGEKKIQFFPMERLEKELELFESMKIPQAFVLDPTYNANKKRALEMLSIIRKKAPDMFFYFEARAEFIDREMARAFASIPCSLQFGLQSADVEVLKKVNRTFDKKQFVKNIGLLNQEGAVFGFDLIFGLPGDTYSGFKNSIDFAMSLYPNNLELFCLSVLPGTTLCEQATELGLTWQASTPYHVVDSVSFPKAELQKAQKLSFACDVFYNQGRAVPWFNIVLKSLHLKPSVFFTQLSQWLEENRILSSGNSLDFNKIMELQQNFLEFLYQKNGQKKMFPLAKDLVVLNGAISECTATGKESVVKLTYHPDDVMSEYTMDFSFFVKNARPMPCKVKVFNSKNGVDFKVVKG